MNLWLLCFSVKSEPFQLHTLPVPAKAGEDFNMQILDHFLLIPSASCRLLEMGLECCIWCEMCGCPEMCVGETLPLLVNPPTKWSSGLNVVINSQQDFFENGSNIENELLEAGPHTWFFQISQHFCNCVIISKILAKPSGRRTDNIFQTLSLKLDHQSRNLYVALFLRASSRTSGKILHFHTSI